MTLVLAMIAAVWAIGVWLKSPVGQRLTVIAVIWAGVIVEQLVLPDGHPLRQATGGSAQVWLVLGGAVALVLAYRFGIARLRDRATPAAPAPPAGAFRPAELDRYARHIMLREIGGPGQRRLKDASVLVVGAGGLGAPALLYLAAAGVGRIGVIDDDVVESSNLQRQVIHTDARLGMPKAQSAVMAMQALNPFVEAQSYTRRLTTEIAADLFADHDLILDGSDNFDTRDLVNRVAVQLRKPLIAAALTQWEGQISLYDPARGGPCYACVFPQRPAPGLVPTCAEAGVAGPLPGVVGSMMALEAVKQITGAGEGLRGRLLLFDGLHGENRSIAVRRRKECPVCGHLHPDDWTAPDAPP
jgi:molybdopterin/thiamine biosynthesis adenylyltransferase